MRPIVLAAILLLTSAMSFSQSFPSRFRPVFAVGSRNTFSAFSSDAATGKGIGAQFRVQFAPGLNSEWYLDYITSRTGATSRNDHHIGWSLLFYLKGNRNFDRLLQPYFIAGHCFDNTTVFETANRANSASRLSMATQAGIGTHLNITPRFDCSLSGQYMLHFGKEIGSGYNNGKLVIRKADHTHPDGHLLFTISFNYKLFGCREG